VAGYNDPTNLDSTYPDSGTDPSVQIHQQLHDHIQTITNKIDKDTFPSASLPVWVFNSGTGLMVPRALLSTDVPGITTESVSGTAYTFVLADAGKLKETTNVATATLTVPPNSSVAFPVGTQVALRQYGSGQLVVAAGAGVTIRSYLAQLKSVGQYAELMLTKRATDEWLLAGPTVA
jgi:3D (Asp-Asp-Asp) domain-containing protein